MQFNDIQKITKCLSDIKKIAPINNNNYNAQSLLNTGIKYAKGGSFTESGFFIRSSINKNPHQSIAHYNLAKLFLQKNNLKCAISALENALMLSPKNIEILLCLAQTLEGYGNINIAKEYYQKIYKINSKIYEPFLGLARVYAKQKRWDESINALRKAKGIAPKEKHVFYCGGLIFIEKGDIDTALIYFIRANKLDPDDKLIIEYLTKFKKIKYK